MDTYTEIWGHFLTLNEMYDKSGLLYVSMPAVHHVRLVGQGEQSVGILYIHMCVFLYVHSS